MRTCTHSGKSSCTYPLKGGSAGTTSSLSIRRYSRPTASLNACAPLQAVNSVLLNNLLELYHSSYPEGTSSHPRDIYATPSTLLLAGFHTGRAAVTCGSSNVRVDALLAQPSMQERAHIRVHCGRAHGKQQGAESADPRKCVVAHSRAAHGDNPDISGRPLQRCPHATQRRLHTVLLRQLRIQSYVHSHGWDMHAIWSQGWMTCKIMPDMVQGLEVTASILCSKDRTLQKGALELHACTYQAGAQAVARAIHPCGWCAPAHAIHHTSADMVLSFSI